MVEPVKTKARIVLAEDDVLLRAGLASLLERSGFEVVAQAGDGEELIAAVREHRPDVAIVDIRMPPAYGTEGLDAAQVIRAEFPTIGILLLSAHVEVEQATELLAKCASRYENAPTDPKYKQTAGYKNGAQRA